MFNGILIIIYHRNTFDFKLICRRAVKNIPKQNIAVLK